MKKHIYRPEIDGLRALAVIAVIVNHYSKGVLPGGYLGVDIFFVISGYVITSALINRNYSSFADFILDFYQRRVKRLLPALIICIAITSLIGLLFIPPSAAEYNTSLKTGITALFGLSNVYLLINSVDYFGNTAEFNLFSQTWSLGVEEQFYLLFPPFIWYITYFHSGPKSIKKLLYLVGIISIISVISFVYLSKEDDSASFYLMSSRIWELGSGCLVFLIRHKHVMVLEKVKWLRADVLLLLLLAALFSPFHDGAFTAISVVLLTSLIIAFIQPSVFVYRMLTLQPVVYLGLISYSLYLWHWSVLVISRWTIGLHWWSLPVQLGLTLILAAATYHYIESPLRYLKWSSRRIITIGYGFIAAIACACLLAGLGLPFRGMLYAGVDVDKAKIFSSQKSTGVSSSEAFIEIQKGMATRRSQCNMTPHHLTGENYRPKPTVDHEFINNCLSDSRLKIILIGDSFANVFSTHIALAAKQIGYEFKMIFGYGCPYPLNKKNISGGTVSRCEIDLEVLKTGLLANINHGDIVALRLYFPKTQYIRLSRSFMKYGGVSAYDKEIEKLHLAIAARGGSLLLIGSNPTLELAQPCFDPQWFNALQEYDCKGVSLRSSVSSEYAMRHDNHLLEKYSSAYPDIAVIAPTLSLCNTHSEFCPTTMAGLNMYVDKHHIGSAAVDLMYPDLIAGMEKLSRNK